MKEVIILYGGNSDENEISELTANSINNHIDRQNFLPTLLNLNDFKVDKIKRDSIVFIAIHGAGGEDGEIQKILKEQAITFTGSIIAFGKLSEFIKNHVKIVGIKSNQKKSL